MEVIIATMHVRKSTGQMKTADVVSISGGSIRRQHFKWNVRFSRHTVINFSSATAVEAAEEAGQPGSN
ncbi:hypothetical protein EXN66_Car004459 [Channa argus]|uniref:Uncharacterized protein n=1 Tax=Channa argus TaxID=215402 RepID=A0A6G1PEX5_CHAAH|nr:hypothetical protein EXN66_Car004459 [Channa argus]